MLRCIVPANHGYSGLVVDVDGERVLAVTHRAHLVVVQWASDVECTKVETKPADIGRALANVVFDVVHVHQASRETFVLQQCTILSHDAFVDDENATNAESKFELMTIQYYLCKQIVYPEAQFPRARPRRFAHSEVV